MKHLNFRMTNRWLLLLLGCWVGLSTSVNAARHALILSLRAGDPEQTGINRTYCLQTRDLFEQAGFDHIDLLFEGGAKNCSESKEASRQGVLNTLKQASTSLSASDEFWLVLYGYANLSPRGTSLLTTGDRLRQQEWVSALEAIPARQMILALNQGASGLMEPLATGSNRTLLCATSKPTQMNPPQLPEYLLPLWQKNPRLDLLQLLHQASQNTVEGYKQKGLALAERAQWFDGQTLLALPLVQQTNLKCGWSLIGPSQSTNPPPEISLTKGQP